VTINSLDQGSFISLSAVAC